MLPVQLRMARAAIGWTVRDLERRCGVSKNTISKYEAGGQIMSDALQRMEQAFKAEGVLLLEPEGDLGPGVRLRIAGRGDGDHAGHRKEAKVVNSGKRKPA
jgi:transcriptional regulator with XRE-family HTH domain